VKILLHGCNGRMGRVITRLVDQSDDAQTEIVCGVDLNPDRFQNTYPVFSSLSEVPSDLRPDVAIDFSHPGSVDALLDFGVRRQTPLVICTSGISGEQRQKISDAAQEIPVLMSANMSLGINLVLALVAQAAQVLGDAFDIEIVEKHHNQKIDAPSGTAIMIANAINEALDNKMGYIYGRYGEDESSKRQANQIGIHAVRGGSIVGEHDTIFAGQGEVVEIKHTALSKDIFGYGALEAARFLLDKPAKLYSMKDVVDTKNS
jgi:4-hydroxy-tetrahydrodipicolinate reductase